MYIEVTEMPSHAMCAVSPAMFLLFGGDVFHIISDFKEINIFSKSCFKSFILFIGFILRCSLNH